MHVCPTPQPPPRRACVSPCTMAAAAPCMRCCCCCIWLGVSAVSARGDVPRYTPVDTAASGCESQFTSWDALRVLLLAVWGAAEGAGARPRPSSPCALTMAACGSACSPRSDRTIPEENVCRRLAARTCKFAAPAGVPFERSAASEPLSTVALVALPVVHCTAPGCALACSPSAAPVPATAGTSCAA